MIMSVQMEKHLGTLHKNTNPTLFLIKSRKYSNGYYIGNTIIGTNVFLHRR